MAEKKVYEMTLDVTGLGGQRKIGTSSQASQSPNSTQPTQSTTGALLQPKTGKVVAGAAVAYAGQIITYQVGRVGVETGNYQKQNEASAFLKLGTTAVGLGTAFAVNPLLGAVALGGMVISQGLSYRTYEYERNYEGQMLSVKRERAGIGFLSSHVRG